MSDGFEDAEALEEHLEAVKPEPVDQEELEELAEPTGGMRTAQDDEQAAIDDAAVGGGSGGDADVSGAAGDGLDEVVEPVSEFRTVQEREGVGEDGGGDE